MGTVFDRFRKYKDGETIDVARRNFRCSSVVSSLMRSFCILGPKLMRLRKEAETHGSLCFFIFVTVFHVVPISGYEKESFIHLVLDSQVYSM